MILPQLPKRGSHKHHQKLLNRLLFTILLSLTLTVSFAQKKEIATARDQVKKGTNLQQAENSMLKLLENPANRGNEKIYRLLNLSIQKQYTQLNEKMYLKQSVDSANVFLTLNRAFNYALMTDSVLKDERKRNEEFLLRYVSNLYVGGIYLFRKEKYADAYALLDTYLTCREHPIFADYKQEMLHEEPAAFRALCCGYRLDDMQKTLKYRAQALSYKPGNLVALKYLAETYQKSDSTFNDYVKTLDVGFATYPCEEYFFTRSLNIYMSNQKQEEALALTDKATGACPQNLVYRYARAHLLLSMERFPESIIAADSALALSDSIADCYYIAGIANVYMAEQLKDKAVKDKALKKKMLEYYSNAQPYMEKYRKREPARKDKWGSPLYNIYLNLNKGKEFDEISKVLRWVL